MHTGRMILWKQPRRENVSVAGQYPPCLEYRQFRFELGGTASAGCVRQIPDGIGRKRSEQRPRVVPRHFRQGAAGFGGPFQRHEMGARLAFFTAAQRIETS